MLSSSSISNRLLQTFLIFKEIGRGDSSICDTLPLAPGMGFTTILRPKFHPLPYLQLLTEWSLGKSYLIDIPLEMCCGENRCEQGSSKRRGKQPSPGVKSASRFDDTSAPFSDNN